MSRVEMCFAQACVTMEVCPVYYNPVEAVTPERRIGEVRMSEE
ncbi:hypothetical protein [Hufsiella arboris]|nr:hypothetical protein [Hufsiella arboris]